MQLWVGDVQRNKLHELGETLVEPQVVPPVHRHQVPEPLNEQESVEEQIQVQAYDSAAIDFGNIVQNQSLLIFKSSLTDKTDAGPPPDVRVHGR